MFVIFKLKAKLLGRVKTLQEGTFLMPVLNILLNPDDTSTFCVSTTAPNDSLTFLSYLAHFALNAACGNFPVAL